MERWISLLGVFTLMLVALVFSPNRKAISWRAVLGALALQFAAAALMLGAEFGRQAFNWINTIVAGFLDFSRQGAMLVFGQLAIPPGQTGPGGEPSLGFFLAFQAMPTVIFVSSLMAGLYYIGLMPLILRIFSWVFTRALRLSGAESLCTASNIFVGIESVFTIRPYIRRMTPSELHMILTAAMSTIASSVLGLYVLTLRDVFPEIAGHLVSASLLSAPAAVVMAKLLLPETERPLTFGQVVEPEKLPASTFVEALLTGASEGLKLAFGIVAMPIAFLGLVALLNGLVGWGGDLLASAGWSAAGGLSIQRLLGAAFYPFTLLIGVAPEDAGLISGILGERIVLTEVVSYQHLSEALRSGALANPRTAAIASYALCGFSHVASMAIFVGGIAALVPERAADLSRLGPRALFASTLACLQTAAVAGVFIGETGGFLIRSAG